MSPKFFSITHIEKLAVAALLLPMVGWALLLLSVSVKKHFPPAIGSKQTLHVETWLTGSRHNTAGVAETLNRSNDTAQWTGQKSKISLDPATGSLKFESSNFEAPAELSYDGFKWSGFTTVAGRGMPVAVIAWPDF